MPLAEQLPETASFERRYYEYWRHQYLAPEIGKAALSGYENRFYDELTSGLAEALKGTITTNYAFETCDDRLIAEDGEQVAQLIERGIAKTFTMVEKDHLFYAPFLMQRANREYDELLEMEIMATGYAENNTMVTFWPYSEEFAQTEDDKKKLLAAAQRPDLKRAMLRLSHWDGQQMHILTRSIDNSSVELLKETAWRYFGYKFEADNSTDMPGERLQFRIEDDRWQSMPDDITAKADEILTERHGGHWKQGRRQGEDQDLQRFVESETAIVNQLIKVSRDLAARHKDFASWEQAFNDERYKYAALLEDRLSRGTTAPLEDIQFAANVSGMVAQAEGRDYVMCGLVLSSKNQTSTAAQTGFESLARLLGKEFESEWCPNCLPEKKSGKKVKAWRKGDHIGCKNCGHVMDYSDPCRPRVVHQGRKR